VILLKANLARSAASLFTVTNHLPSNLPQDLTITKEGLGVGPLRVTVSSAQASPTPNDVSGLSLVKVIVHVAWVIGTISIANINLDVFLGGTTKVKATEAQGDTAEPPFA
jgi:hypothetical protein